MTDSSEQTVQVHVHRLEGDDGHLFAKVVRGVLIIKDGKRIGTFDLKSLAEPLHFTEQSVRIKE